MPAGKLVRDGVEYVVISRRPTLEVEGRSIPYTSTLSTIMDYDDGSIDVQTLDEAPAESFLVKSGTQEIVPQALGEPSPSHFRLSDSGGAMRAAINQESQQLDSRSADRIRRQLDPRALLSHLNERSAKNNGVVESDANGRVTSIVIDYGGGMETVSVSYTGQGVIEKLQYLRLRGGEVEHEEIFTLVP